MAGAKRSGFASGDTLDLEGETVTKLSYADSTLTLTLSTGQTQTIGFTGSFGSLTDKSDGSGGTYIQATAASDSARATQPDVFLHHANLARSDGFASAGSGDFGGGPLHAGFAEMMAYALDGGAGAMSGSLHEAAANHAATAEILAAALHPAR